MMKVFAAFDMADKFHHILQTAGDRQVGQSGPSWRHGGDLRRKGIKIAAVRLLWRMKRQVQQTVGLVVEGRGGNGLFHPSICQRPVSFLKRWKSLPTARVPEVRIAGRSWFQRVDRGWAAMSVTTAHSMAPPRRFSMA